MKDYMKWLLASVVIMVALPIVVLEVLNVGVAMAVLTLLLFAVCPIYSVLLGVFAGKDGKRFWSLPVISPLLSLATMGILLGDNGFARFAGVYLILGLTAMAASMIVRRNAQLKIVE